MPSELSLPNASEQELAARAAGLKVVGVPADLVRLVRDCRGASATEILERFYLPNVLGYAYLARGLAIGIINREKSGGLHAFSDPVVELVEPDDFEAATDDDDPRVILPRQTALELLRARGEVTTSTRALCIHDRDGLGPCLAASGAARVVALDHDDAVLDRWETLGVHGVRGDLRLASGFPFGVFDLVTSYQLPGDHDDSLIDTVLANLAPYGTYLTCFPGATSERMDLIAFLSQLEGVLVITDMSEHHGTFVFRAVKVPELRGNPDFLRHYVR
jgi:hypothetical protein